MMSAAAGYDNSVKEIRGEALRAHKEAADEMKSDQRGTTVAAYLRSRGL